MLILPIIVSLSMSPAPTNVILTTGEELGGRCAGDSSAGIVFVGPEAAPIQVLKIVPGQRSEWNFSMLSFAVKSRRTPGALLVNDVDASAMLGVSRATFWRLVDAKKAPRPVKLGRRTLWRVAELEKLCQRS